MKFLYLIPFLFPNLTLACGPESLSDYALAFFGVFIVTFIPWVFLACCSLFIMRLLPRNKGLTMSTILVKAKRRILVGTGIIFTLLVISFAGLVGFSLYQSHIPAGAKSSDFAYPIC